MMLPRLFFKKFRVEEFHAMRYGDRSCGLRDLVRGAESQGMFFLQPGEDRYVAGTIVVDVMDGLPWALREVLPMAHDDGRFLGTIGVSRYQFDLALASFMGCDMVRIYPCAIDEIRTEYRLVAVERHVLSRLGYGRVRFKTESDLLNLLVGERANLLT